MRFIINSLILITYDTQGFISKRYHLLSIRSQASSLQLERDRCFCKLRKRRCRGLGVAVVLLVSLANIEFCCCNLIHFTYHVGESREKKIIYTTYCGPNYTLITGFYDWKLYCIFSTIVVILY